MDFRNDVVIAGMVAITLILGGVIGYTFSAWQNTQDSQQAEIATNTSAAGLRVGFNNAFRERVLLTSEVLRNTYEDAESTEASLSVLNDNNRELARLFGQVYGQEKEQSLRELLQEHTSYFVDYATAIKNSDQNVKTEALNGLAENEEQMNEFFNKTVLKIEKGSIKSLQKEHNNLMTSVVDTYAAGNFKQSLNKELEAAEQISQVADALSTAIAQQFPDEF